MSANDLIVEMTQITKHFPGVKALDKVSFSCIRGEIHALLGENGAGKSTLIKTLGGVYLPDSGEIKLEGKPVFLRNPHHAQMSGIGTIHQELILVPYMTVAENIFLGQEKTDALKFVKNASMKREAEKVLELIGANLNPADIVVSLDSANQKLVQIAKSLIRKPKILIVDEPTAPLGTLEVENFFNALHLLKNQGTTVVYISHHLEEVFEIADRLTVLKDGKNVVTRDVKDVNVDDVVRYMIGRELGDLFPSKQPDTGDGRTILSVRNLNRGKTLYDVNLELKSGEILGVAALEGNGQNALLRTIFGAYANDTGEIRIDGVPVKIKKPLDAITAGVALVTDKRHAEGLCLQLSVNDNIALPSLRQRQAFGVISRKREKSLVDRNIQNFNIRTSSPDKQVRYLSGGNQQKIVIGKWLNKDPKIIFFIEPTLGVDVGAKAEIYQVIRALADKEGKGVVLVTSDMLELLGLCDRILVMHKGRITREFQRDEATEERILKAAVGVQAE